ncbi:MAG: peptidylprolyl isomerase [candidate division KSB1 bacterium]|nr:peptidylprolyl isomerase [candidate division KSB1 bacterium]MDZ7379924.1 peptidylprolyl isomerase [candidate division KSB1 bacterium]MDZ7385410.1 peptidylprolyl isomerase [candidate division KSB1 bacterium]MDZ7391920.1 peptidylprolyl isomerase [candidate division KSB1 bacterium]MDZ7413535.1 peptidylprolyl isomerase [candidate division KSB1 bacterium]
MRGQVVFVAALALLFVASCARKEKKVECPTLTAQQIEELKGAVKAMPLEPVNANEVAVMKTNLGTMVIGFFPDKAPLHCAAFKRLVNAGFYNCTKFHRLIKDFVVQGGDILSRDADPGNDGTGNPGYTLPAEFNDVPHDKGILSMARTPDPNSAGSQFFICLTRERTAFLDGQYTVFGRVIEGMEVLDKINALETVQVSPQMAVPKTPLVLEEIHMEQR